MKGESFNEMLARGDLELHCTALLKLLLQNRNEIISGRLPSRASLKKLKASADKECDVAGLGAVIGEWASPLVSEHLHLNGLSSSAMFWESHEPSGIRGASLSMLFPAGKDMVLKDLQGLLDGTFYLKNNMADLLPEKRLSNEESINNFENQIAWIWLLNRHALNNFMLQFDDENSSLCVDLSALMKLVNVLGRHAPAKKTYDPIV